jgi:hypothetical protein
MMKLDMDSQNVCVREREREREGGVYIEKYGFFQVGLRIHTSEGKMHTVFISNNFLPQGAVIFFFLVSILQKTVPQQGFISVQY